VPGRSTPAPVSERTSISAATWESGSLRLVTVPSQPRRNASGIVTSPGLSSGNQEKSTVGSVIIEALRPLASAGLPDTTGEKTISSRHEPRPP